MAVTQLERNGALSGVHGVVRLKKGLTWPTLSETLIDRWQLSRAIEDSRQFVCVLALALEGAAHGGKGFLERKNVARHQEIAVLRANRMPEHTLCRDRDFWN